MKWGHDDLMHDLADHLRQPDRMVWTDMQLGPSGSPRPDVFTMYKSYTKPKPMVYEIKVSVSDFRSDITSGKWQSYMKFASGIYFAVPAGLITKADVPTGCGLIVRGDESWRVLKAPTLQAVKPDFYAMHKLLIDGVNRLVPEQRREHWRGWINSKEADKALGKDVAAAVRDLKRARDQAADLQAMVDNELSRARSVAEDIRKRAREQADRFIREGNESMAELYEFLGLPPGAGRYAVDNRIRDLKRQLDANEMVKAARRAIEVMENSIDKARAIVGDNDNNPEDETSNVRTTRS